MTLTLTDTASGPLRAFTDILTQLKASSVGVSKNLEGIAAGITNIGKAAAGATTVNSFAASLASLTTAMTSVKTASAGVAQAVGNIGNRASVAGVGTYSLAQAMGALGGTLNGIVTRLTATAAGLGQVGAQARAAGAGVAAGAANMGAGLGGVNTQATTLAGTLKGLAALWGALEIKKGLTASIHDAADFQRTENRLNNMNESPEGAATMRGAARDVGKSFHQFNQNELLEMVIDLRQVTGNAHEAAAGLGDFAKAVFAINLSLPNGQKLGPQDTLNLGKILEIRGASVDPDKRKAALEEIVQIVASTQGRVNPANLFGNLTYARGGLGRTMDADTMRAFAAIIEEDTVGGGSGGRAGTMVSALVNSVSKSTAVTTKNRDEWMRLGLVDPEKVNVNKNTNQVTSIQPGAIAGSESISQFKKWVDNYLRAALIASGVDMDNPEAVKAKTDVLFPNRLASEGAFQLLTRKSLIEKQMSQSSQAAGLDQQVNNGGGLAVAQFERFRKAVDDLGNAIGTSLLPVITPLIEGLTKLINKLSEFSTKHPVFGFLLGMTGTVGMVAIGIRGLTLLLGPLSTLFLGGGTAAGGMGAALATAATAIGTAATFILRWMLRLVPVVGLIMLAWDFAPLIANIDVNGKRIGDWANELATTVSNAFQRAWIRSKQFLGLITTEAANAQANAVGSGPAHGASGSWEDAIRPGGGGKFSGHGASGGWGEETDPAIAALLAANKAAAGNLGGGKEKAGRFAHYDAELDAAKNANRLLEDEQKRHQHVEDELYKAGKISVDDYYDDKLKTLTASILKEIAELEKEKSAYTKQGDKAGVNRTTTDITLKTRELMGAPDLIDIERKQALIKLDKDAINVQRALMQTSGQKHAAEMLHAQQELEANLKLLVLNKDRTHVTQEMADAYLAMNKAAQDLRSGDQDIPKLREDYAARVAAINDAERNGTLSGTAAEQQKFDLMKQESLELDELIAKRRALAVASGDEKEVLALDKLGTKNRSTQGQLPADTTTMLKATQSGFAGVFSAILRGTESAGSAIEKFGQNLKNTFLDIISKKLGDALFDSLFPKTMGGGGSGGDLLSLIGRFFGFGGGSGSVGAATSIPMQPGGGYAVGIDRVPRDMWAPIHKDERVMTAKDNGRYTSFLDAMQRGGTQGPTTVTLQAHPDIMNMRFQDVLDAHISHAMATR